MSPNLSSSPSSSRHPSSSKSRSFRCPRRSFRWPTGGEVSPLVKQQPHRPLRLARRSWNRLRRSSPRLPFLPLLLSMRNLLRLPRSPRPLSSPRTPFPRHQWRRRRRSGRMAFLDPISRPPVPLCPLPLGLYRWRRRPDQASSKSVRAPLRPAHLPLSSPLASLPDLEPPSLPSLPTSLPPTNLSARRVCPASTAPCPPLPNPKRSPCRQ